jgi:hypothetical protein
VNASTEAGFPVWRVRAGSLTNEPLRDTGRREPQVGERV